VPGLDRPGHFQPCPSEKRKVETIQNCINVEEFIMSKTLVAYILGFY
jgi:hypothetical protein